jgi:hypothetical protein
MFNMFKWLFSVSLLTILSSIVEIRSIGAAKPQHVFSQHTKHWQLNFTSTAPHIFQSARSLLQQWPNTFYPNGHSIVPCQVPRYTNLYHADFNGQFPPSPEWVAFDVYAHRLAFHRKYY